MLAAMRRWWENTRSVGADEAPTPLTDHPADGGRTAMADTHLSTLWSLAYFNLRNLLREWSARGDADTFRRLRALWEA